MTKPQPAAFLSYVHSDDDHDLGGISKFRERLEGEVRMHMGKPFPIFQDRNDLAWGQNWADRINQSLEDVTFLIPIVTPSFFQSPACRDEFLTFRRREETLGVSQLILPVYYLTCDELEPDYISEANDVVDVLRSRQWTDWRKFRFKTFEDPDLRAALASLAETIKISISEITELFRTADEKATEATPSIQVGETPAAPSKRARKAAGGGDATLPGLEVSPSSPPAKQNSRARNKTEKAKPYKIYTTEYDEIVAPGSLISGDESRLLYEYISRYSEELALEHSASLSELADGMKKVSRPDQVAVQILIDNSGSLRGPPILYAASWALLILEFLERYEVATAVTGYTTRTWKGGQSREKWLKNGRPLHPGRLNDVRYIVYKEFEEPFRDSAINFGLMVREGLLKENIDGEALQWAWHKLAVRPEKTKILMVISDGAPVDDSTLSENGGTYLERHLRGVIADLGRQKDIALIAIGMGYDISRYYGKSGIKASTQDLGLKAIRRTVEILQGRA